MRLGRHVGEVGQELVQGDAQAAQAERLGPQAGKIKHPSGFSSTYRRQVLKGTNNAQGKKQGELTLDYDFTTNVDGVNYCYSRNLAKFANANAWKDQKKTLKHVQNSLAYSGPGAPEGQDPGDF